jgi:hypothetical protein
MAELKTQPTNASVADFIAGIVDEPRRRDCETILALMRGVTQTEPQMWGTAIVGFGQYHYQYESGRSGAWFRMGFSPRKANLTLYLAPGLAAHADLLPTLGKHTTGQSCLYIKKLADIHLPVLKTMLERVQQNG